MKNLLNCHVIGLHSFPISLDENGLYRRIFYADTNHELWKSVALAIHPHHVDIKITVLDGVLFNQIYELTSSGQVFKAYHWNSHILNGDGGFEYLGDQGLELVSSYPYPAGETVTMKACELHTVQIQKGQSCVWLIEETKPSCDYFPINYSQNDLENWNTEGLYIECNEATKNHYIGKYI